MLVIAKVRGEYPLGVWRNPGETFKFEGKKPGAWMDVAEKPGTDDAEAKAEAAAKAIGDAKESKALAKEDADAVALAKETADQLAADDAPKFKAIHRGAGKWDVFNEDLDVVEGGDNLNKADAAELVKKLLK